MATQRAIGKEIDFEKFRLRSFVDRLVDIGAHADQDGVRWFGLWSGGQFFPIIPSVELG